VYFSGEAFDLLWESWVPNLDDSRKKSKRCVLFDVLFDGCVYFHLISRISLFAFDYFVGGDLDQIVIFKCGH
jgi:hypothetical protein